MNKHDLSGVNRFCCLNTIHVILIAKKTIGLVRNNLQMNPFLPDILKALFLNSIIKTLFNRVVIIPDESFNLLRNRRMILYPIGLGF